MMSREDTIAAIRALGPQHADIDVSRSDAYLGAYLDAVRASRAKAGRADSEQPPARKQPLPSTREYRVDEKARK